MTERKPAAARAPAAGAPKRCFTPASRAGQTFSSSSDPPKRKLIPAVSAAVTRAF